MAKRMIFITGGSQSGKSRYALDYANRHFLRKLYLATSEALDEEMVRRIELHKKARGREWQTVEEPIEVVSRIRQYADKVDIILLDCMTLWLSNLLLRWDQEQKIIDEIGRLSETIREIETPLIMVSNEVGMGLVPVDPLGRRFRDLSGVANQRMAEAADTVIFMVSGIPMFLKGEK